MNHRNLPVQMEALMCNNKGNMSRLHTIERVVRFHLSFEGIHPFIDSNGRTGRLLVNLDLMQRSYPPINIIFANRHRYCHCFDAFYGDDNVDEMVFLIAKYEVSEIDRYFA